MAGIVDGLGFEELGQAGSQISQLWLTGSVTSESQISGANVYATTLVQADTIKGDVAVSGLVISGGNALITGYSGTNINNTDGELQSIAIGSGTSTFGAKMVAGSGNVGVDSGAYISFNTAFAGVPAVLITQRESADKVVTAGSISVGSFYAESPNASDAFSWAAIGI